MVYYNRQSDISNYQGFNQIKAASLQNFCLGDCQPLVGSNLPYPMTSSGKGSMVGIEISVNDTNVEVSGLSMESIVPVSLSVNDKSHPQELLPRSRLPTYAPRKDVIYRSAFRKMRKFFLQDFIKFSCRDTSKVGYYRRLENYIRERFPNVNQERLTSVMNCIINSRGTFQKFSKGEKELRQKVVDAVYFYTRRKLNALRRESAFFQILLYFLTQPNTTEIVCNSCSSTAEEVVKLYLWELKAHAVGSVPNNLIEFA